MYVYYTCSTVVVHVELTDENLKHFLHFLFCLLSIKCEHLYPVHPYFHVLIQGVNVDVLNVHVHTSSILYTLWVNNVCSNYDMSVTAWSCTLFICWPCIDNVCWFVLYTIPYTGTCVSWCCFCKTRNTLWKRYQMFSNKAVVQKICRLIWSIHLL